MQNQELDQVKKERRAYQFKLYFLAVVALGCFGGFVVVVKRYHSTLLTTKKLHKENQAIHQKLMEKKVLEEKRLQQDLDRKKEHLTGFGLEIKRKQELLTTLSKRISDLEKAEDKAPGLRELQKYLKRQMQIKSQPEHLLEASLENDTDFFHRLSHQYPHLTQKEKQLASLIRLNLSNKEIAEVKNITSGSAKVLRHRLRKKLTIPSGTDLAKFLISF